MMKVYAVSARLTFRVSAFPSETARARAQDRFVKLRSPHRATRVPQVSFRMDRGRRKRRRNTNSCYGRLAFGTEPRTARFASGHRAYH